MNPKKLKKGKTYRVQFTRTNGSKSNMVKRIFFGTEKRFGEIMCYVFSSRITKACNTNKSEVSIPFYDLKTVEPT